MVRKIIRRKPRSYNQVTHYFHNFEHDPKGLTHCKSNGNHPYTIEHFQGKHKISGRVAIGHGKAGKSQKFKFTRRLGNGYDLASGVKA